MKEIEVNHFTKDYGSGRGVFDVSFEVNKGEVFGFLGPNGAGKSTTIRHLMGFSKPQKGNTKILGLDSFQNYTSFMDKVGYLPGEIALPDGLTGIEFLDMMKKMKKCKDEEWIKYLIDYFELDARGETKRMSLGVKRKLAVVV
ncbi:MAG: ATP-binding cassette domain-containing protein, partial [Clostridia bacterium]|nr:ATP-binding cassette domain-containing protein [Clostridia bacterium]